jgi:integrase/recombinase XerD
LEGSIPSPLRFTGRGRITSLTKATTDVLRERLAERGGQPDEPLFPTSTGTPLTRKALARRIATHAACAAASCPSLAAKTITPHVLRHTAAMSLLTSVLHRGSRVGNRRVVLLASASA